MKKKVLFGLLLATLALSGCNQNKSKDDSANVSMGKQLNASQVAADVKAKYDEGQLDYTGDKLTVQRNEPVKLTIDFSPRDLGMKNFTEVVEIYQDSNLTQSLGTHFNMDDDHTYIEVLPPRSAVAAVSQLDVNKKDYGFEQSNLMLFQKDENQDWGNLSEVYMAVKVDLETGEPLDKPLVTPIRIAHEIAGDLRLKLSLTEEGTPTFSWNELEGADYYYLVDVDYKEDKGVTGQGFVREKITDGTSFEAEPGAQFITYKVPEIDRQKEEVIKEYGPGTGPIQREDDTEHRYAVVAVSKDGTSSMSNTLSLKDLAKRIPYAEEIGKSTEEEGNTTAAEMGLLPAYRWVTMSDGSLVQKLIKYDTSKAKEATELWSSYEKEDLSDLETHEVELITIPYTVEGTPFSGKAKVESYNAKTWKEDLEKIKERQDQLRNKAGNTQVEMTTEEVEEQTTQTSNTKESTTESSSSTKESSSTSQSSKEEETESSSSQRRRKTKASESSSSESSSSKESTNRRKKDNKKTNSEATVSETKDKITANSALSEYLAINMLDGKTEIDIQEFPEALVQETLFESWMEAIYQNPLILGAEGAQISNFGKTLKVTYNTKPEEMKKKQEELRKEVKKVVKDIIKKDMTDLEKEYAINAYLTEIAEYDNGALENAEKNNFEKVDAEFNDSFTPYGVLINKVGVCASYAGGF